MCLCNLLFLWGPFIVFLEFFFVGGPWNLTHTQRPPRDTCFCVFVELLPFLCLGCKGSNHRHTGPIPWFGGTHQVAADHVETPICCCRTEEDHSAPPGDTRQGQWWWKGPSCSVLVAEGIKRQTLLSLCISRNHKNRRVGYCSLWQHSVFAVFSTNTFCSPNRILLKNIQ